MRAARTIVRSQVNVAHNLGLKVCTEGVEIAAALQFLELAGSEFCPGLLFGPATGGGEYPRRDSFEPQTRCSGLAPSV